MNGRTPGIPLETVPFVGVMQEIWRHEGNITILFCGVGVEFIPLFCDEPQPVVMRMRANAVGINVRTKLREVHTRNTGCS
jgi:hypothetical protein